MLDEYYSEELRAITDSVPCAIELPKSMERFFECSGDAAIAPHEERRFMRVRARVQAVGHFEKIIPSIERANELFAVYTADFSRTGCSFISHFQLFPTEGIRLLLPKFWLRVEVVRCRKIGPKCYENGALLISRNDPSEQAFEGIKRPALA